MYTDQAFKTAEYLFNIKPEQMAKLAQALKDLSDNNGYINYSNQDFNIKQQMAGLITKGLSK